MKNLYLFILLFTFLNVQARIYVNKYADGANNGTTWEDAYIDLQMALKSANAGEEIWIANGSYYPSETDRTISFVIDKPLKLYGGFDGRETSPDQRHEMGKSILNGDLGVVNDTTDNSMHVLLIENVGEQILLNAIEVRSGNANGIDERDKKGGGIYCENSELVMENCSVIENRSTNEAAGIYFAPDTPGELNITNSYFQRNLSEDSEAIWVSGKDNLLKIENTKFLFHNQGNSMIKADSCNVYSKGNRFDRNENKSDGLYAIKGTNEHEISLIRDSFTENSTTFLFYCINAEGITVTVDSCSFAGNNLDRGSCIEGDNLDTISIRNTTFINNTADGTMGLYLNPVGSVFLRNVTFNNNNVDTYGCAYIECSTFQADVLEISDMDADAWAIGMFIRSKKETHINNGKFERIKSGSDGLFEITTSDTTAVGSINYSTFKDITTRGSAGAMYIAGFDNFAIGNCTFNDISGQNGGAYRLEGTKTHVVYGCEFDNCSSIRGGAIKLHSDLFVLNNSVFSNNYAEAQGGAIEASADRLQISNTVFNNNNCDNIGGAIYSYGSNCVIHNSDFTNNKAEWLGGAAYCDYKDVLVANSFFKNNHLIFEADDNPQYISGGALYINTSGSSKLYGNILHDNSAGSGGAIYIDDEPLSENLIINNTLLKNSTSTNSSGALHVTNGSSVIKNNILWDNGNFSVTGSSNASFSYQATISNGIIEPGIILEDPGLLDYKPAANSIAINNGVEDTLHTTINYQLNKDIYSNDRFQSGKVDIGAVETEYNATYYPVHGKVMHSKTGNCDVATDTNGIEGVLMYAVSSTGEKYYSSTNEDGEYTFQLSAGVWSFIQLLNSDREGVVEYLCPKNGAYNFVNIDGPTEIPTFYDKIIFCELVDVSINTGRTRNCYPGKRSVFVTNFSDYPLTNKNLNLERSNKFTSLISSTPQPVLSENEQQNLIYQLPVIQPYETYELNLVDSVSCDPYAENLGEQIEMKASIEVEEECNRFDHSYVKLDGKCVGDTATFNISTVEGSGDAFISSYRLFLNDTLIKRNSISILPDESVKITLPNNYGVTRLELGDTDRPEEIKMFTLPSCNLEYVGLSGYYNITTLEPKSEITHYSTITGSYDPNEIVVTPKGWEDDGSILKDQLLNYKIYFQNTGNDTAFTVKIIDTLSSEFDLNTFRNLHASHKAEMQIIGSSPSVAIWSLENINLPDSTTDLIGSQGFVSFAVRLNESVEIGSQILNSANIYFDYNVPIQTNTVLNTVKENYPENLTVGNSVVIDELITGETSKSFNVNITLAPNPFSGSFHVYGVREGSSIRIVSPTGSEILKQKVSEGSVVTIPNSVKGILIYEIYNPKSLIIERGKVLAK